MKDDGLYLVHISGKDDYMNSTNVHGGVAKTGVRSLNT